MAARDTKAATGSKRSANEPLSPKWRIAQARRTDEWRMRHPLQPERDPFGQHYGTRMGAINHALSTEPRTVLEIADEAGLDGANKSVLNGVRSHLQWLKRQGYVQGRGRGLWSFTTKGAKLMRKISGSKHAAAEEPIKPHVILTAKDRVYRAFLDNPEITFDEAQRHASDKSDVTVRNWLHRAKRDYSALRFWQEAHSSSNELRSHVPVNTRDLWNEAIAYARAHDSHRKLFFAKVRDLGKPYADGTPKLEINLAKEEAVGLPFQIDDRVSVPLRVAGREYDAGLRSTSHHTDVWISPDLYASDGERLTLGRVLTDAGFEANYAVRLLFDGRIIEVQTTDGRPSKDTGMTTNSSGQNQWRSPESRAAHEQRKGSFLASLPEWLRESDERSPLSGLLLRSQAGQIDVAILDGANTVAKAHRAMQERFGYDHMPRIRNHFRYLVEHGLLARNHDGTYSVSKPITSEPSAFQLHEIARNLEREQYFDTGSEKDERERTLRETVQRKGQPAFRRKLLHAYGGRCAVTRCDATDALEACHITPYLGKKSNLVSNGLLLRADIHTLFDLDLIGIDPRSLRVVLAPRLRSSFYSKLDGRRLAKLNDGRLRPNQDALQRRWERFCRLNGMCSGTDEHPILNEQRLLEEQHAGS